MTDNEIDFGGKKLISLKRASENSGYAKDYIGQLCRGGKIVCQRIGRDWFVDFDNLSSYKELKKISKMREPKPFKKNERQISPARDFDFKKIKTGFFERAQNSLKDIHIKIKGDQWDRELFGAHEPGFLSAKKISSFLSPIISVAIVAVILIGSFVYPAEIFAGYEKLRKTVNKIASNAGEAVFEFEGNLDYLLDSAPEIFSIAGKENSANALNQYSSIIERTGESIASFSIDASKITINLLSEFHLPEMPDIQIPKIPKISMPKLPDINISVPDIKFPEFRLGDPKALSAALSNSILGFWDTAEDSIEKMGFGISGGIISFASTTAFTTKSALEDVAEGARLFPQNIKELAQEFFGQQEKEIVVLHTETKTDTKKIKEFKSEIELLKESGLAVESPVVERIVVERTVEKVLAGMNSEEIEERLQILNNSLMSEILEVKNELARRTDSPYNATVASTFQAVAHTQKINNLSNVTISGATISGSSVSGYLPTSGGTLSGALSGTSITTSGDLSVGGDLTVTGAQTYSGAGSFTASSTSPALLANQTGSGPVVDFQKSGTSALYITTAGNVGIGTTTPSEKLYIDGGFIAKGPLVDVRAYGAKGDGVTDDTTAIQAAIDAAGIGGTLLIPDTGADYLVSNINFKYDQMTILGYGKIRTLNGSTSPVVTIGESGVSHNGIKGNLYLKGSADPDNTAIGSIPDIVGILIVGLARSHLTIEADGFQDNIKLQGTAGKGVANNTFIIPRSGNYKRYGIYLTADDTGGAGWVNSNNFFGNYIYGAAGGTHGQQWAIRIDYSGTNIPNTNKFYNFDMESTRNGIYVNGISNIFDNVRYEGSSNFNSFEFGPNSVGNSISLTYNSAFNLAPYTSLNYTSDNTITGTYNTVNGIAAVKEDLSKGKLAKVVSGSGTKYITLMEAFDGTPNYVGYLEVGTDSAPDVSTPPTALTFSGYRDYGKGNEFNDRTDNDVTTHHNFKQSSMSLGTLRLTDLLGNGAAIDPVLSIRTSGTGREIFRVMKNNSGGGYDRTAAIFSTGQAFFNGNVGIGTTSPYAKLSVVGETVSEYFTATSTSATSTFSGGLSAASSLYVLQNGNVGIGTTNPGSYKLYTEGQSYFYTTSGYGVTGYGDVNGRGVYGYSSNGTGVLGVTAGSGDVGVYGSASRGYAGYFIQSGTLYANYSSPVLYAYRNNNLNGYDQTGAILKIEDNTTSSGNLLEIIKQSSTKMMVDNSGNVGIGTTSPYAKLSVWGDGTSGATAFNVVDNASTTLFTVLDNGNVGIGTTTLTENLNVNGAIRFGNTSNSNEGTIRWTGTDFEGYATSSNWKSLTRVENYADHIIFKDSEGYKAYRTEDATITHSHATDCAAVINDLLSSLTLVYSPSSPNIYARGTNPNGFKEGRTVRVTAGNCQVYQTLNIPPSQDFVFDAEDVIISSSNFTGGDTIFIDSAMNSHFSLGIVVNYSDTYAAVRVKPTNVGPDDLTTVTTSIIEIEAVVNKGDGLVLDSTNSTITHTQARINEVNLSSGNRRGVVTMGSNNILGNEVSVMRMNSALTALSIANTSTYKNVFYIDRSEYAPTISDGSNGLNVIKVVNEIDGAYSFLTGAIGIGTSQPGQNLAGGTTDVIIPESFMHIKSTSNRSRFIVEGQSGAQFEIIDLGGGANDKVYDLFVDAGVARWRTLNDDMSLGRDIMTMDLGTGNVGIGTTSPYAKLSVVGETVSEYFTATSTSATSTFSGGLSAASSLYVLQNGNVGIGTTNPSHLLQVNGTARANQLNVGVSAAGIREINIVNGGRLQWQTAAGVEAGYIAGSSANTGDLQFFTSNNQDFIFNSGNVGIGTTSPYAKLSVVGETVSEYFTATSTSATSTFYGSLSADNGTLFVHAPTNRVGIASSTPYAAQFAIEMDGSGYPFMIGDAGTSTPPLYMDGAGITYIEDMRTGLMSFDTNAGAVTWIDMPVTSGAAAGTVESYTAQIDSTSILTVYAESDGLGGIQNWSVGLGTTSPRLPDTYALVLAGKKAYCDQTSCWLDASTRDIKTNITELTNEDISEVLAQIASTSVYFYNTKYEPDGRQYLGVISEESPDWITTEDKKAISASAFANFLMAGMKGALNEISNIKTQISNSDLTAIASNPDFVITESFQWILDQFKQIGVFFGDSMVKAREFVADRITANKAVLDALEMTDSVTGEVYCVRISNGEWDKFKGTCGEYPSQFSIANNQTTPAATTTATMPTLSEVGTPASDTESQSVGTASTSTPVETVSSVSTSTPEAITASTTQKIATSTPSATVEQLATSTPASNTATSTTTTTPSNISTALDY